MLKIPVKFLIIALTIVNLIAWKSYTIFFATIFISAIFFYFAQKRPLMGSYFITLLLLAGVLLRLAYLDVTPYLVRSYDVSGHIDYINYIISHFSLPSAEVCWECYQPPLYYILSAGIFTVIKFNPVFLQVISLIFSFGFLFFGIKLLRLFIPSQNDEKYLNIAVALLIFWPSGIINSVRIGNDGLLYFLTAASFYYITLWFINGGKKNVCLATIFGIACMFTKNNGILLILIIGFIWLIKYIWNKNKKLLLYSSLFLLLIGIFFAGFTMLLKPNQDHIGNVLVGNINGLPIELKVGNKVANFITFDSKDFFRNPFTDPWSDKGGRQYFLNYFLKTSLFGEFQFWQPAFKNLAILMSYLIILVIFLLFISIFLLIVDFFKKQYENIPPHMIAIILIAVFISALIVFRYIAPFSCSGDFRYIYPIIIPVSALITLGIRNSKGINLYKNFSLAWIGELIIGYFIIASVLFFIFLAVV